MNYLHSDRQVSGVGNDNVYVYGCYIASTTSDDRLKHNEAVITSGLSVARRLVPLTYDMTHEMRAADYKGPVENPSKGSGFIAQALLQIPELAHAVMENPNPETIPYRVNYAETIAYAFAAIKELDALVQTMRNEINELKNKASN